MAVVFAAESAEIAIWRIYGECRTQSRAGVIVRTFRWLGPDARGADDSAHRPLTPTNCSAVRLREATFPPLELARAAPKDQDPGDLER